MALPTFFRVHLSTDILFPKKNNAELHIKTEFRMLEEMLTDERCYFEPVFGEKRTNLLLSVIPVKVFLSRSVSQSRNTITGLALKAEKMSDISEYLLDTVLIDCLIPIDILSIVNEAEFHTDGELSTKLKKICLDAILKQTNEYIEKLTANPDVPIEPMHFAIGTKIFSVLLPSEATRQQCLALVRDEYGSNELIHGDILSEVWSMEAGCHLINPHQNLPTPEPFDHNAPITPGKSATIEMALVPGYYRYFRYNEDGFSDSGWGCAYRSLQTVCSWFRMQSFTDNPEPDHKTIQKVLVDIGDKDKNFIGSTRWIGSLEVGYFLENYLGVKSRIVSVSSGDELDSLASQLIQHFRAEGAPVMIGGGVLAHTIAGVFLNRSTGVVRYLVLDPHYNAPSKSTYAEEMKAVTAKGSVGWKDMTFWKKGEFYNLCLPLRPKLDSKIV